jgi:hypothetical protein
LRRHLTSNDTARVEEALAALVASMEQRPRPVRVVPKRGCLHQRAAAWVLWALTFGGQRTYLTHYVTTIGHTIYVPDGFEAWPPARALEVLRHELVHVAQFERLGFVGMAVIYLLLPLPAGLAYGRARLEWEAYRETLLAVAEIEGLAVARLPALREAIVARFTGPDYGWMWPFPAVVRRWIDEELAAIEARMDGDDGDGDGASSLTAHARDS